MVGRMSQERGQLIRFSYVERYQDTAPRPLSLTPERFTAELARAGRELEGKNGPALLPATFRQGKRGRAHVEAVHLLALDFDGIPDEHLAALRAALPYGGWLYSTFSHGLVTPEQKWREGTSRLRVVLPLSRAITGTPAEIARHVRGILEALVTPLPDEAKCEPVFDIKASSNIAGLHFLPRKRDPRHTIEPFIETLEGDWLDPDNFEPIEEARYTAPDNVDSSTIEDAHWLESALDVLDPNDYHAWKDTGMSLYHSFGDAAFEMWSEWSSRAAGADDEAKLWKKWKTFDDPSRDEKRKVGSIWHDAVKLGWTPPVRPGRTRRMADPYEGLEPLDLTGARVSVRHAVFDALDRPGCTAIPADTETGKSTSAIAAKVERLLLSKDTITFSAISNELTHELLDRMLDHAQREYGPAAREKLSAITAYDGARRGDDEEHPHYCPKLQLYQALASRDPEVAGRFCNSECLYHPDRDVRSTCKFVDTSRAARDGGGRAIFRTHHMQRIRRTIIDKRSPGRIHDPLRRVDWLGALRVFGYVDEEGKALHLDALDHYPESRYIVELVRRPTTLSLEVRETLPSETGVQPPDFDEGDLARCKRTVTRYRPTKHEVELDSFELTTQGRITLALWAMNTRGDTWCDDPLTEERAGELAPLWHVFMNPDVWSEGSIIHDEDMLGAALPSEYIDRDVLKNLFAYGALIREDGSTPHINDEDVRTWLEALEGLDKSATLSSLNVPLPALREPDDLEWLDIAMEAAGHDLDKIHDIPEPSKAAAWTALVERGGQGAFIMGKTLYIEIVHELLMPYYRSQIILDATPSIPALKAMLPGVQIKRISAKLHPGTYTARLDMALPSSDDLERDDRNHQHKLRWHVAHDLGAGAIRSIRGEGAALLHMPRSAQMPDRYEPVSEMSPQQQLIDHMVSAKGDLATHINGSLSRGSNEFEHCAGVIQDDYRAPRGAILARAELLQYLSGDDSVDWEAHATWSIEGAPCAQGIQRVRARGNARTLLYTSRIDYPGHTPDEVIDEAFIDACAALAYGVLPAHNRAPKDSLSAAAIIMRLALECCGGTWHAGDWRDLPKKVKMTASTATPLNHFNDSTFSLLPEGQKFTLRRALLGEALKRARHVSIKNKGKSITSRGGSRCSHFAMRISSKMTASTATLAWPCKIRAIFTSRHCANRSWEKYAEMMGVNHSQPATNLGARSPHFLHLGELDFERVKVVCKDAGATWVELDGERIDLTPPRPPFADWLAARPSKEEITWETVQAFFEVRNRRSAGRCAHAAGYGTLKAMRAHWQRINLPAPTPEQTTRRASSPPPFNPFFVDVQAHHLLQLHRADVASREETCSEVREQVVTTAPRQVIEDVPQSVPRRVEPPAPLSERAYRLELDRWLGDVEHLAWPHDVNLPDRWLDHAFPSQWFADLEDWRERCARGEEVIDWPPEQMCELWQQHSEAFFDLARTWRPGLEEMPPPVDDFSSLWAKLEDVLDSVRPSMVEPRPALDSARIGVMRRSMVHVIDVVEGVTSATTDNTLLERLHAVHFSSRALLVRINELLDFAETMIPSRGPLGLSQRYQFDELSERVWSQQAVWWLHARQLSPSPHDSVYPLYEHEGMHISRGPVGYPAYGPALSSTERPAARVWVPPVTDSRYDDRAIAAGWPWVDALRAQGTNVEAHVAWELGEVSLNAGVVFPIMPALYVEDWILTSCFIAWHMRDDTHVFDDVFDFLDNAYVRLTHGEGIPTMRCFPMAPLIEYLNFDDVPDENDIRILDEWLTVKNVRECIHRICLEEGWSPGELKASNVNLVLHGKVTHAPLLWRELHNDAARFEAQIDDSACVQ